MREKWPVEGSHFPTQQGIVQNQGAVLKKVAFVGCTQAIFRQLRSFQLDKKEYPVVS